jgi:hypothetical protein
MGEKGYESDRSQVFDVLLKSVNELTSADADQSMSKERESDCCCSLCEQMPCRRGNNTD